MDGERQLMVFTSQDAYNGCGGPGLYWKETRGTNSTLGATKPSGTIVTTKPRQQETRGTNSTLGASTIVTTKPRRNRRAVDRHYVGLGSTNAKGRPSLNCNDIAIELSARAVGNDMKYQYAAKKKPGPKLNQKAGNWLDVKVAALGSTVEEDRDLRGIADQAAQELRAAMDASVNEFADAAVVSRAEAADVYYRVDAADAEAWPALGGSFRANDWELVNGSVEAWEVVDEQADAMVAPAHDEVEEGGWVLTSDGDDAGLESDSDNESTPSSVVMVPPPSYLAALKLSTAALPEHPRAAERAAERAAARPHGRRLRETRDKAAGETAGSAEKQGRVDRTWEDYDALKDSHNHATRTRKSKQSMASRSRRLAAKGPR